MANPDLWDGHLLKGPKNKRKGNPLLRKKRLNFATPAQTERKEVWAFIKETFILSQQRTNGHTSCMQCKLKNPKRLDLDHITPTGKGGDWVPANAMLLCRGPGTNDCHSKKHGAPQWTGGDAA